MISGGALAEGDDKITDIVENELGACIVAEDNCTGLKPLYNQIGEDGDVFENIARGYLGQAPCARMKPIEEAISFSVDLAKEYNADGVIFYYLKFCPCYSITISKYLEAFQKAGIPAIVLGGDYSGGDVGQIRTRLEAFVEMIGKNDRFTEKEI